MPKKLKKSELILLGVLIFLLFVSLILVVLVPKHKEKQALIKERDSIIASNDKQKSEDAINNADDNPKTSAEKQLDNRLLELKANTFISDFSQETIILKLNEFIEPADSLLETLQIDQVTFLQAVNVPRESIENGMFFKTALTPTRSSAIPSVEDAQNAMTDTMTNDDNKDTSADGTNNQNPDVTTPPADASDLNITSNADAEQAQSGETAETDPSIIPGLEPLSGQTLVSNYIGANIQFTTSYDKLVEYIKNLEAYTDSVAIVSINIEPVVELNTEKESEDESTSGYKIITSDGYVTDAPDKLFTEKAIIKGTMEVVFVEYPVYYDDGIEYTPSVLDEYRNSVISENSNPFEPFANFTHYKLPEQTTDDSLNFNFNDDNYGSDDSGYSSIPKTIQKRIYDFEKNEFFFASTPSSTKGSVSSSSLSYSGNRSGKLSFNFVKGVETSTASLVFDNKSISVTEPVQSIGLAVSELSDFTYDLGITIKDSSGQSFNLPLKRDSSESYLWDYYSAEVPSLNAPFIVTRVYVTTEGHEKVQTSGDLLLDSIQVTVANPLY